jgi:hypothetical protein
MSERTMRAKMAVSMVQVHETRVNDKGQYDPNAAPTKSMETLTMHAVAASSYPADGSDENNTYAKMSPGANLCINIANPALWGKFKHGDQFYVDFTKAD